jgi:glycosyltransferase involved in cell wall biosynthesis
MENFFSIVVDTCNQEKWIKQCLDSCVSQNYNNYEIIIVDAKSDDSTYDICLEYKNENPKIKLYQNEVRQPQVANFIWLSKLSRDGSIIVSIDGDDWFKHNMVLEKLNEVYNSGEVWMTYGTYEEFPYRDVSRHYHPYPQDVINQNTFREYKWLASHLRTFRKELILKINESDLLDNTGVWLPTTGDQAIMLPMLEMSSEKSRYVSDILYVYNAYDTSRDSVLNLKKQVELEKYVRLKTKYERIDKL